MGSHDPFGHLKHVMAKRRAMSQIATKKSVIAPNSLRTSGVRNIIGKISTRATTLL